MNKGISFSDYCEANGKNELLSEWLAEKNGDLSADRILSGSNKKVWWKCSLGHEWQATIKARTAGCLCPVCQNRVVAAGVNDFAANYPQLAREWHPNKNLPVTPAEIFAGSVKR